MAQVLGLVPHMMGELKEVPTLCQPVGTVVGPRLPVDPDFQNLLAQNAVPRRRGIKQELSV